MQCALQHVSHHHHIIIIIIITTSTVLMQQLTIRPTKRLLALEANTVPLGELTTDYRHHTQTTGSCHSSLPVNELRLCVAFRGP